MASRARFGDTNAKESDESYERPVVRSKLKQTSNAQRATSNLEFFSCLRHGPCKPLIRQRSTVLEAIFSVPRGDGDLAPCLSAG